MKNEKWNLWKGGEGGENERNEKAQRTATAASHADGIGMSCTPAVIYTGSHQAFSELSAVRCPLSSCRPSVRPANAGETTAHKKKRKETKRKIPLAPFPNWREAAAVQARECLGSSKADEGVGRRKKEKKKGGGGAVTRVAPAGRPLAPSVCRYTAPSTIHHPALRPSVHPSTHPPVRPSTGRWESRHATAIAGRRR